MKDQLNEDFLAFIELLEAKNVEYLTKHCIPT